MARYLERKSAAAMLIALGAIAKTAQANAAVPPSLQPSQGPFDPLITLVVEMTQAIVRATIAPSITFAADPNRTDLVDEILGGMVQSCRNKSAIAQIEGIRDALDDFDVDVLAIGRPRPRWPGSTGCRSRPRHR